MNASVGKPNILFVTSTLYLGGAQKVTSILANALSEKYNVTVAYCFDSGRSHPFSEACSIRKLPEYDKDAGFPDKILCTGKQIRALKALKKELSIDAAISLGNVSNVINALSKRREHVICSERSNPKKSWGKLFFLIRYSFQKADYIVFQSEKIRDFFGKRIRRKSCILKNPVSIPDPAYDHREKKIVALGRFSEQKNHALLIRSFARFHEQFPAYKLHIFGDGELKNDLQRLIRSLAMSDHILLVENDPSVHERIRDAEMFVLSSDYEGLSNALLECMSMGIACISTRCEGSVDVIRHKENGLLVDIGDEKALAQAMSVLARDPELRKRLERQAMEDLKAYSKDVVVKNWEHVIRQCISSV